MCLMLLLVLAGTGRVVASSAMGEAGNISADFTRLDHIAHRLCLAHIYRSDSLGIRL